MSKNSVTGLVLALVFSLRVHAQQAEPMIAHVSFQTIHPHLPPGVPNDIALMKCLALPDGSDLIYGLIRGASFMRHRDELTPIKGMADEVFTGTACFDGKLVWTHTVVRGGRNPANVVRIVDPARGEVIHSINLDNELPPGGSYQGSMAALEPGRVVGAFMPPDLVGRPLRPAVVLEFSYSPNPNPSHQVRTLLTTSSTDRSSDSITAKLEMDVLPVPFPRHGVAVRYVVFRRTSKGGRARPLVWDTKSPQPQILPVPSDWRGDCYDGPEGAMIFPAPGRNQMIVFSPDRPEIAMVPIDQPTESRFAVVDGNVICFRAGGTFIAHLSDLRFRQVGMGFEIVNRIDRSNNYGLITVNDNAEMTGISLGPMPGGPGRGR